MEEKHFTKAEIQQFRADLYNELIKMGEDPEYAKKEAGYSEKPICSEEADCAEEIGYSDRAYREIMQYHTPAEYAEMMMMM
ncbi:MAG: hypothetical protein RR037_07005 [Alistipes sp.]